MVQAMVAGQLPIGSGAISTVMNARAGGLKVKYARDGRGHAYRLGDHRHRSRHPVGEGPQGKKIGTGRAGAISHWSGAADAKWQGWQPTGGRIVGVGGASALQGALLGKQIDGILVWPPAFRSSSPRSRRRTSSSP
jgi:ABC-type nitrate/sulfonate/bicarbonate transport system substrate-binding protein